MTQHKKESSYLKHNYCVDLVIYSPLGQKSNGLMTSLCVHHVLLASISQKPLRIYFHNLAQKYLMALLLCTRNISLWSARIGAEPTNEDKVIKN